MSLSGILILASFIFPPPLSLSAGRRLCMNHDRKKEKELTGDALAAQEKAAKERAEKYSQLQLQFVAKVALALTPRCIHFDQASRQGVRSRRPSGVESDPRD